MKNYNKFMEKFWLGVAVLSAIIIGYTFFILEEDSHPTVLVLPFMALIMFFIRRWFRKRVEKDNPANSNDDNS